MPYPDNLLVSGEKIYVRKRPHWKVLILPIIFFILIVGGCAALLAFANSRGWNWPSWAVWAIIGIAVIALIVLVLVPFIRWRTEHFVISNHHIFFRTGLLSRREHQIPLGQIANMETEVTFWGRLMGYGSLIVESSADQPLKFRNVANLPKVQSMLNQLIRDEKELTHRGNMQVDDYAADDSDRGRQEAPATGPHPQTGGWPAQPDPAQGQQPAYGQQPYGGGYPQQPGQPTQAYTQAYPPPGYGQGYPPPGYQPGPQQGYQQGYQAGYQQPYPQQPAYPPSGYQQGAYPSAGGGQPGYAPHGYQPAPQWTAPAMDQGPAADPAGSSWGQAVPDRNEPAPSAEPTVMTRLPSAEPPAGTAEPATEPSAEPEPTVLTRAAGADESAAVPGPAPRGRHARPTEQTRLPNFAEPDPTVAMRSPSADPDSATTETDDPPGREA